jgi:hypothetical protein
VRERGATVWHWDLPTFLQAAEQAAVRWSCCISVWGGSSHKSQSETPICGVLCAVGIGLIISPCFARPSP